MAALARRFDRAGRHQEQNSKRNFQHAFRSHTNQNMKGVKNMEWPLQAYSVKLKRKVDIAEDSMELVTMKNGRHAVRGVAVEDRSINVFRILGNAEVEEVRQKLQSSPK